MLLCADIEPMRAFRVDTLGLAIHREGPGRYLELQLGATTLALRLRTRPYGGLPAPDESASVQLGFQGPPGDVDIAAQQLPAH